MVVNAQRDLRRLAFVGTLLRRGKCVTVRVGLRVSKLCNGWRAIRPRAIHFAPTILPQDISVSSNWNGIHERGRMKNIIVLIYL